MILFCYVNRFVCLLQSLILLVLKQIWDIRQFFPEDFKSQMWLLCILTPEMGRKIRFQEVGKKKKKARQIFFSHSGWVFKCFGALEHPIKANLKAAPLSLSWGWVMQARRDWLLFWGSSSAMQLLQGLERGAVRRDPGTCTRTQDGTLCPSAAFVWGARLWGVRSFNLNEGHGDLQ